MGSSVASPSIISRTLAIYVARNFFARTYPNVFKMPRTQFSPATHVARLARMTLRRNLATPADPHDLSETKGIVGIRLVYLRRRAALACRASM
jgi:hypothetical protein